MLHCPATRVSLAVALALSTSACGSKDIPQYVKGPVSGYVYDCEQEKQKAPAITDYVTAADFDGDGLPDHLVDSGKGCAANRLLYCGDEGCTVNVYLSTASGLGGYFKARAWRVGEHGGKPAVFVTSGGAACGKPATSECSTTYVFNGRQLAPVK